MQQEELFVRGWREGVRAIAARLGTRGRSGMDVLGDKLRPELEDPIAAGKWLQNAVNPEHQQTFDAEYFLKTLEIGNEVGVHVLMHHACERANYSMPAPITRQDRAAELDKKITTLCETLPQLIEEYKTLRGKD